MKIISQKIGSAYFSLSCFRLRQMIKWTFISSRRVTKIIGIMLVIILCFSCANTKANHKINQTQIKHKLTAKNILEDPDYLAISYGGYREISRDQQPTIQELKDDMKILHAMGIRIIRTYNVQLAQAPNLLQAITELRNADPSFEMYVMLGAWIDCLNAWTDLSPDHNFESDQNTGEINRAVALAQKYPNIVKIIAVGNEAMVKWATAYFVQPSVILKWVNYLQGLKKSSELPADLWITSSDDFSSWGGGDAKYHVADLEKLMHAVDYISIHTYPYHNSHYNPDFWGVPDHELDLPDIDKINNAMNRALEFSQAQYASTINYMKSIDINKPVHIGEAGWATISNGLYGNKGSRATDQYKQGLYYKLMREWTNKSGISCFYFEAFDEQWKDADNSKGSENHFGLMTLDGQAKYALWNFVDKGTFKGLTRNGNAIKKTLNGNKEKLLKELLVPPARHEIMV